MRTPKMIRIAQIGPYPPPSAGWSFRIKLLKEETNARKNSHCKILNIGRSRKMKSNEFIGVKNGIDYIFKLFFLRLQGYRFHLHANAQAVKGPLLVLSGHLISIITFKRAAMTFHGGYTQLNFPKENGNKMYLIIYLNFLLSKIIICNDVHIKKDIVRYGWFINHKKIFPIQAFSNQYVSLEKSAIPEDLELYITKKKHLIVCYVFFRHGFYLEVLCRLIENLPENIGIIITGAGAVEDDHVLPYAKQIKQFADEGRIVLKDTLAHSQFISLMGKSDIFLRTPISDGVASSVLEALMCRTIVVASENGHRPEGVVTYEPDNPEDLKFKILDILENKDHYKRQAKVPEITDTVKQEVDTLIKYLG